MEIIELKNILEKRYHKNIHRHRGVDWKSILILLDDNKLGKILKMEDTGGEPDLLIIDDKFYYVDMAKESPNGRRSMCYDQLARENRKKFPPENSVLEMATEMGIEVLDESMYFKLQEIEALDLKSSSWIKTDDKFRSLGGALFACNRYQKVFVYHNGADSYYKDRAFRAFVKIN